MAGNGRRGQHRPRRFTTPARYDIVAARIGANQMKEQKSQFIPGLGILLLTIVLLGTVGALLRDFNGVRFGAWGAIIWGLAALSTFVLGTAYLSRRLLPIQDNLGWSNGFRLLWKNYLLGVAGLLSNNRQESSARYAPPKKKKSDEGEPAPSFKYLKAGFLFTHEAAAITNGSSYSRAAGPGLIILRGGETISQVFDLRRQSRKLPVSATTRDGIPVKTSISVTFQVRPPAPDQRRPRSIESDIIPYPYDPGALFELTYSAGMVDGQRRDWTEQVAPQAAALLITEIGKFSLDKLLESGGAGPLGTIKESIKRGLEDQQRDGNSQILSRGVKIVGISVGPLELPKEIIAKRLSTWQVDWQNRSDYETISGDIEAQRLYQQARVHAQVENIEKLLLNIEAMQEQGGVALHDAVMLRLMEVAEAISSEQALTSGAARSALKSLTDEATNELRSAMGTENDGK